ncbi:hypothetical protein SERLA73DRAFT_80393 [Serpula lacrymans var. lacrymans S7.3]|uniref:Uncharacterized protein n=1 Tax=Serpula lacrymans var. lacrymans (strain S7.3) TaxID=936435 RepID=F8QJL8_SERL3|nr:hypothetical protein SERLA73DRAFT_80393 [Serpula lacrymans var. lacrymans S7.3]
MALSQLPETLYLALQALPTMSRFSNSELEDLIDGDTLASCINIPGPSASKTELAVDDENCC